MTDRYVNPAVGSSGTGGSWAQAYKTLKEATDAAAAGETIYFANGTADTITADTTYTLAAGVRVISTSDTTNNPPTTYATGAKISTSTSGVDVFLSGEGVSWFGVIFDGNTSTGGFTVSIGSTNKDSLDLVDCAFELDGTTSGGSSVNVGLSGAVRYAKARLINCSFVWGSTGQGIALGSILEAYDCDFSAGATHPSVLFEVIAYDGTAFLYGCDLSDIDAVFETTPANTLIASLSQCKLKSGATVFASTSLGLGDVCVYDCDAGDVHYNIAHYNYVGSTTVTTSIYANDNICDANISWVVAGNANTTAAFPYLSPWISVQHTGTSAITPYLECVRSGSSTAFTEAEVWAEWLVKTNSGSTKAEFYTNRASPLGTASNNENSSKGASDWTGENATSWFGKLQPNASFTPAEAGMISARVGVAANVTVYVDPQIRGLS